MRYYVEITVYAEVETDDLRTLVNKISDDGWTVYTLLDHNGRSGTIYVRDENNDVVAEL